MVGIGASAGGLEALNEFFRNVPVDSGMAFVVVQHLDPTQKALMPELLQGVTSLKIFQVKDRMRVRANCVYLIPPNCDMSVRRGSLHLVAPVERRGSRLPINFFFRSLAQDRRERAVGVVLSGMGEDGTMGLRAIKEQAGLTLAQEPNTAKFDAMPRSAITAGVVDLIAPASKLPARILVYLRSRPRLSGSSRRPNGGAPDALGKIVLLLRTHTGHDFTLYRRSTLDRRVEHRMGLHRIIKIDDYVRYLRENAQEVGILFKELLIGVTGFFRDPVAWRQLEKRVIPALLAGRPGGTALRAWVAGCSTGEEAFSLAMVFMEAVRKRKARATFSLQIYATDLDKDAIEKARAGYYPESIATTLSPRRLERFFTRELRGYRIKKEIRAMVVFAPQNLIMDPPFTKLDILCCRNLLIYLTPELQKKILPLFHYALNPRGVLFLGSSESLGGLARLFTPLAQKERIFQRNELTRRDTPYELPAVFTAGPLTSPFVSPSAHGRTASLQSVADQLLQARFSPPAVLVNTEGDILYISGRINFYLEPAAGKANWNIVAMARGGLRYELPRALQTVLKTKEVVTLSGVRTEVEDIVRIVDVTVQRLEEPKELAGMILIVFSRVAVRAEGGENKPRSIPPLHSWPREYARELQRAHREVQLCREQMQTSAEEQRSLNEELQSTNEELQSTNEELTTSKEEMQSLNEELQTVNAELHAKLDELSSAQNDMKNLLNSTDIATVFLDNGLCIRRFTLQAKTIIKFIASDVGRPVTDLASDLLYPALVDDVQLVLRTQAVAERTITSRDGRWFGVRIMPYHTADNRVDGVVITFADITAAKKIEAELRTKNRQLIVEAAAKQRALSAALKRLERGESGRRGSVRQTKPSLRKPATDAPRSI